MVPEVPYADIRDGKVSEATKAAIRRTGCAVVRGVYPETMATDWFAEVGAYLDDNRYEEKEIEKKVLLHGHCHQKAFDAMPAVQKVLRMIPGVEPALIETSCCGMAGSFGYEAEHYDVSLKMAEMTLLPAIRKAGDALVVADGTSCRHQILDGAGREAVHVARVLELAL